MHDPPNCGTLSNAQAPPPRLGLSGGSAQAVAERSSEDHQRRAHCSEACCTSRQSNHDLMSRSVRGVKSPIFLSAPGLCR